MKTKRPNEMSAWKTRVAELMKKEARCPGCAKAKKQFPDAPFNPICNAHQTMRTRMVFG